MVGLLVQAHDQYLNQPSTLELPNEAAKKVAQFELTKYVVTYFGLCTVLNSPQTAISASHIKDEQRTFSIMKIGNVVKYSLISSRISNNIKQIRELEEGWGKLNK